jgi:hypothetical protein
VSLESNALLLEGTVFPFPLPSNHCRTHNWPSELPSETEDVDTLVTGRFSMGEEKAKPNGPVGSFAGENSQGGNGNPIGGRGGGQN